MTKITRIRELSDLESQQYGEFNFVKRMIVEVYSKGIVSIIADTFNLWHFLDVYLPRLKDVILKREGKVVIRPDSGDPVEILPEVVQRLWNTFGGTINDKGYKVLDSHIGAIYGDSITYDRARKILSKLMEMKFCSTNVVFGIGSFTYQYITRDTLGFAIKSTYGEINGQGIEISKNPITDNGVKKSHKGLLTVTEVNGKLVCNQQTDGNGGLLVPVYKDGKQLVYHTLKEIRNKVGFIKS